MTPREVVARTIRFEGADRLLKLRISVGDEERQTHAQALGQGQKPCGQTGAFGQQIFAEEQFGRVAERSFSNVKLEVSLYDGEHPALSVSHQQGTGPHRRQTCAGRWTGHHGHDHGGRWPGNARRPTYTSRGCGGTVR